MNTDECTEKRKANEMEERRKRGERFIYLKENTLCEEM